MPVGYTHGRVAILKIDNVDYSPYAKNVKYPRERKTDTTEVIGNNPPVKLDGPIDGDPTFDIILHGTPVAALLVLLASGAIVTSEYGPQGNLAGSGAVEITNTCTVAKVDFDTEGSKSGMAAVRLSLQGADVYGTY